MTCPSNPARAAVGHGVLAVLALVACNDGVPAPADGSAAPPQTDARVGCSSRVVEPIVEHACLHARVGPYQEISAAPDTARAPTVDRPHTAFRIATRSSGGVVRYTPRRDGDYAFFVAPAVSLDLVLGDAPLPWRLAHDLGSCSSLVQVWVATLRGGETYALRLRTPEDAALLVIENLGEFGDEVYDETCAADAGIDASLPDAPGDGGRDGGLDAAEPADAAPANLDAMDAPDAACTPVVGEPVITHACLHVAHGPFATVLADADPAMATASISTPHTAYTVDLRLEGPLHRGVVIYRPAQDGEHALFVDPAVPLEIRDPDGAEIHVIARHAVTTCSGISAAVVVRLQRQVRYRIAIPPVAAASVRVLVENLDAFAPVMSRR